MVDKPDSRFPPMCLKPKLNSQSLAFTIIFQRTSSFVPYNNWRFFVDCTNFINFMESTEIPKHAIIVSMDMTSLYTNIPQEEEINTTCICKAYDILITKIDP